MERHHGEFLPGVGLQIERGPEHRIIVVGAVDDERTALVGRDGEERLAVELDLARGLSEFQVHGQRRFGIHADLRTVGQHDVELLAARRAVFQRLCGADLRAVSGIGNRGNALPEPDGANARRQDRGRRDVTPEQSPARIHPLGNGEQDFVAGREPRPLPLRLGRCGLLPAGETLPELGPVFVGLLQPSRQHTGLLPAQGIVPVGIDQSVYLLLHNLHKTDFFLCFH